MAHRLADSPLQPRKRQSGYIPEVSIQLLSSSSAKKYSVDSTTQSKGTKSRRKRSLVPIHSDSQVELSRKIFHEYEATLQRGDFKRMLYMIEHGEIPADYETTSGETALFAIIGAKNVTAFHLLMDSIGGCSINFSNRRGYTPLIKAIATAVPFANAHPTKHATRTPHLREEVSNNHTTFQDDEYDNRMIECVLGYHPNLNHRDQSGQTAWDWAARTHNTPALTLLKKYKESQRLIDQDSAGRAQRRQVCEAILQQHENVALQMEALLHRPLLQESDLLDLLHQVPSDLKRPDTFIQAWDDYKVLVSTLHQSDAYTVNTFFVYRETRAGWTPLTKAAANGFVEAAKVLLDMGAQVNQESCRLRHTPLTWASYCGHEAFVLLLLRRGADVTQRTIEGKTALLHAVQNKQATIVQHLLKAMHDHSLEVSSTMVDGKYGFHPYEQVESINHTGSSHKGRTKSKPIVALEWDEVFLSLLSAPNDPNQDLILYVTTSACDEDPIQVTIRKMLQHAIQEAQAHRVYVTTNRERTQRSSCRFEGCTFMAPRDLLPRHEHYECPQREIPCEKCNETIRFDQLSVHLDRQCTQRLVPCINQQYGCQVQVVFAQRSLHELYHCPKRMASCRLGCEDFSRRPIHLTMDQLDQHEQNKCPLRLISCPRECGIPSFPAHQTKKHLKEECTQRLIPCPLACGQDIVAATLLLHTTSLCVYRRIECQWKEIGCMELIGGTAESRIHHEQEECIYRLIPCKYACPESGKFPHCYEKEHYQWQCTMVPKQCDLDGCTSNLPAHWMDTHQLEDAGDCSKRKTRCRMDLCGKNIVLYDASFAQNRSNMSEHLSSHVGNEERFSLRGFDRRLASCATVLQSFTHENQEDVVYRTNTIARNYVIKWLTQYHSILQQQAEQIRVSKHEGSQICHILTFSPDTLLHLLSFRDGHLEWLSLEGCEYDIILTNEEDHSTLSFSCGYVTADQRINHEANECIHRLVPCPLACGQRLVSHAMSQHLLKRCNLRNEKCRLGCGLVLPFVSLSQHEEQNCALRSIVCSYCHATFAFRGLARHVEKDCLQAPRRCRFGCSTSVSIAQYTQHETMECPKRLIQCSDCHQTMWYSEKAIHREEVCPLRVFGPCELGCGENLIFRAINDHQLYHCSMRLIPCPQCQDIITWKELGVHQTMLCTKRQIYCHRGCGQRIIESDKDQHEIQDCTRRLVYCMNQCGLQVEATQQYQHSKLQCSYRIISCPNDCGEQLLAYQCESHRQLCRQRLVPCGMGSKQCARPIRVWIQNNELVSCAAHQATGFLYALKTHDEPLVTFFLQHLTKKENQINLEFSNGFAPLTIAASLGNVDIVKLLLRYGADVNHETSRGRTPLAEAVMSRDPAMVLVLIENRACVVSTNRHGQSVLALAESFAVAERKQSPSETRSQRVLTLMKEREALETMQHALFIAIACSNYDYVTSLFQHSNPSWSLAQLQQQVDEKQVEYDQQAHAFEESLEELNQSVATTETMNTMVTRLREQVEDCQSQIHQVNQETEVLVETSNGLETDVLDHIREITAQDIAQLLNAHTPTPEYLVVMKSICMLCGVVPRGRVHAQEYTDLEWWRTAQALLMDRHLLQKLRSYRSQTITPDVMAKVRRECMKTIAFQNCTVDSSTIDSSIPRKTKVSHRRHPRRLPKKESMRGNLVGIFTTWVQGVEMEYHVKHEQNVLNDKKRRLTMTLTSTEALLEKAMFDRNVQSRALPIRQVEMEQVRTKRELLKRELDIAQQRVRAYQVLHHAALNGHTPLSFACAIGNEAMVHMLLSHGALGGYSIQEQEMNASLIQLAFRQYRFRQHATKSKSDATLNALVHNVAQSFLLDHWIRKRKFYRQTHRVPLHEAIYNGYPQIVEILLSPQGNARLSQKTHIFPIKMIPGSMHPPEMMNAGRSLSQQGGWTLVPLIHKKHMERLSPAQHEKELIPMTVGDTLRHAEWKFDSKTFRPQSGGWHDHHYPYRYSETIEYLTDALTTLSALQTRQKTEILGRKQVAKKTKELQSLHTRLEEEMIRQDFHAISSLLDEGAYADYETKHGLTILMVACMDIQYVQNQDGISVLTVEYLLDRPVNRPMIDFESSTGATALAVAAQYGTITCAQILLERGAHVNLTTRLYGETALMVAAQHGQIAFVEYLLRWKETNVFLKDKGNKSGSIRTAYDYASNLGFMNIKKVLGAAMGGYRGHMFSHVNASYGVCKWGCGFMDRLEGCNVQNSVIQNATFPLQEHEDHTCPKRVVSCPNGVCGRLEPLWWEEVPFHLQHECPLRVIPCPNSQCTAQIMFQDLQLHATQECLFRTIHCECGDSMLYQKYLLHAQNQCLQRLIPCPAQCLSDDGSIVLIRFCELKQHERNECLHRLVRCRNGCSITTLVCKDREHHETEVCDVRRVVCKWECGESNVLANHQVYHETQECIQRQVACPNKCGQHIVFVQLEQHVTSQCRHRFTLCTLGCGRKIPLHTMSQHIEAECRRRIVQCSLCNQEMQEGDLFGHKTTDCSNRLTECGLCGESNLVYTQLTKHRNETCRMRQVQCRYQCFIKSLVAHEKEAHEQFNCTFRTMYCPLGCGQTLIAHTLKRHEKQCVARIVPCSNGCGVELREKDRLEHEQSYCSLARGVKSQRKSEFN